MGKGKHQKIESSEEEDGNDYQKDDFLVGSDEEENNEEIADDPDDSSDIQQLSDDDIDLIEENKREARQGRLRKNIADNEEEEQQIEEDQIELEQSAEVVDENEQQELINKLFDPSQRDQAFLNQFDEEILKQDVPESIQMTYTKMTGTILTGPREEANEEELKWIGERMLTEFEVKNDPKQFMVDIKLILEIYRKENLDIMYIYTYKKHLIISPLNLYHYWRIRELDYEWEHFSKFKNKILTTINEIPQDVQCQRNTIYLYLEKAKEIDDLQNLKDYIDYILLKHKCKRQIPIEEELNNMTLNQKKQQKKEKAMIEFVRAKVDEVAKVFCYTADEFFEVLQQHPITLNRQMIQSWEELSSLIKLEKYEQTEYFSMLKKYVMMELYHHPFIRDYIAKVYRDKLLISTEPTQLGNREITAVSYFYQVKRIKNRPFRYIEDQMWMQCIRAEEQGYIKIQFTIQKEKDSGKDKMPKDDIMMIFFDKFVNMQGVKESENLIKTRNYMVKGLLLELWYPILEKQVKQRLRITGCKHIQRMCQQKFKQLINKQPHVKESFNEINNNQLNSDVKIMSLVIGSDQNESQTLKAYSTDQTVQKKYIGMAIVDYKGESQMLQVFNYLTQDERKLDIKDSIQKDQALMDNFFEKYKPDLVVVSANHPDCLKLRADLRKKYQQSHKCWITLADSQISRIYSMSTKSKSQLQDIPQILKEAISLARFKLNPMAEVLNLWSDQLDRNGCLHLNLHPLQNMVSQQSLADALQQTAIEIVNQVGVDLVDCALHQHLSEQMQFVNGLGRRQAKNLLLMTRGYLSKSLFENNYENEKLIYQKLEQDQQNYIMLTRTDILRTQILKKIVFKNVCGFIKIARGIHPLDITRLSPKMYTDAAHIAKCALEKGGKDDRQNTNLRELMQKPQLMEDLQLDDWAQKKELNEGYEKYYLVVQFMKDELTFPFQYKFETTNKEMSNSEIFYAITQESPYTFRKHSVVQGTITKKIEGKDQNKGGDKLIVRLSDNGLCGTLRREDMFQQDLTIGQIVKAYVKCIPATENNNKNDSLNILVIELTLNLAPKQWKIEEYLAPESYDPWPYQSITYKDYTTKILNTFDVSKFIQSDIPVVPLDQMPNKQKQQQKLILRNINHPKFKSVLLKGALEFIESQPVGEYLIRPNQRLKDHLTITWKFYEGVVAHLYIEEIKQANSYRPQLKLGNKFYESFDEIYENYITPCNLYMEAVANNRKFYNVTMEQLEKKLKEDKERDEEVIPYGFCVTDKAPQFIVLMYMKEKNKVEKEFIKVKPEGLCFHQIMQNNLKELILWFKKNFRTPEYKSYVRRTKPPIIETNDKLNQINQQWDVKKEKTKEEKTKNEDGGYNTTCSKCNKRGHNANECRRDKGRNSGGYNDSKNCHNCGQSGHIKKNCPKLSQRRDRSNSREQEKYSKKNVQPKVEEQTMDW